MSLLIVAFLLAIVGALWVLPSWPSVRFRTAVLLPVIGAALIIQGYFLMSWVELDGLAASLPQAIMAILDSLNVGSEVEEFLRSYQTISGWVLLTRIPIVQSSLQMVLLSPLLVAVGGLVSSLLSLARVRSLRWVPLLIVVPTALSAIALLASMQRIRVLGLDPALIELALGVLPIRLGLIMGGGYWLTLLGMILTAIGLTLAATHPLPAGHTPTGRRTLSRRDRSRLRRPTPSRPRR